MQCYVVVFDRYLNVFVARKNIQGQKFEGVQTSPSYLNYGGQVVFPGGKVEEGNLQDEALREFQEETGIDLKQYIDGNKMTTVNFGDFSATYCLIDNDYKEGLVINANKNVTFGKTPDDELDQLGFLSFDAAYDVLKTWDSSLTTPQAERVLSKRSKWSMDKSWFQKIMDHLKANFSG
jgi:8-oxo-dGTP pyrophosphatase MutT (NUDIX family)